MITLDRTGLPADPTLAARFAVASIPSARVLWLNERWFAEQGIDLDRAGTRRDAEAWILERFGVTADPTGDRELWAESYGVTDGSIHGGGGRVGSLDGFNGKGVGRTPMAADNTDFHHSHGCLWLYEAVREVVASEVAAAELPHGAVPIVALIDTTLDIDVPGSTELARRAIAVRPDFVRPAAFERSIFFGTAGFRGSDQERDAERVSRRISDACGGTGAFAGKLVTPETIVARIAEQLGAGRAARLWQGQFSSANLGVDGAWADFGAFCGMEDWRRTERTLGERFGDDERLIEATIKSLCFYWSRHGDHGDPGRRAALLIGRLPGLVDQAFTAGIRAGLHLDTLVPAAAGGSIAEVLRRYFSHQQHQRAIYEDDREDPSPWIGLTIDREDSVADLPKDAEHDIQRAFHSLFLAEGPNRALRRAVARRFFLARPALSQGRADARFKSQSNPSGYRFDYSPETIRDYIDRSIATSRRAWPQLPRHLVVSAHSQRGAAQRLRVVDLHRSGKASWLLTVPTAPNGPRTGDRDLPHLLERGRCVESRGSLVTHSIDAEDCPGPSVPGDDRVFGDLHVWS